MLPILRDKTNSVRRSTDITDHVLNRLLNRLLPIFKEKGILYVACGFHCLYKYNITQRRGCFKTKNHANYCLVLNIVYRLLNLFLIRIKGEWSKISHFHNFRQLSH